MVITMENITSVREAAEKVNISKGTQQKNPSSC